MRTQTISVEVVTLPVSDVQRSLRFYVDQVGFKLDVDYSPNEAFASCNSLHQAQAARSRSVKDSPTRLPVHFGTSISLSRTSRPLGATCSNVELTSVRSGTRRPLEPGTAVSHRDSIPRMETMPALLSSPIRMVTAGCSRNGATVRDASRVRIGEAESTGIGTSDPADCEARKTLGKTDRSRAF